MKRVGQLYRERMKDQIKRAIDENENVFVLGYSSLSSLKLSNLRKDLKKIGAKVFVSKNTLARLALKELKHDALAERLSDQTAFIWTNKDSSEISKILVKFVKDSASKASIKGGMIGEASVLEADVKKLSDLPSREVLLAQLLGTIQAPVSRLLGAFNAKSGELLSILKQYSEKKGGS